MSLFTLIPFLLLISVGFPNGFSAAVDYWYQLKKTCVYSRSSNERGRPRRRGGRRVRPQQLILTGRGGLPRLPPVARLVAGRAAPLLPARVPLAAAAAGARAARAPAAPALPAPRPAAARTRRQKRTVTHSWYK